MESDWGTADKMTAGEMPAGFWWNFPKAARDEHGDSSWVGVTCPMFRRHARQHTESNCTFGQERGNQQVVEMSRKSAGNMLELSKAK